MTAEIKTYLLMGLQQLQGHLNAGAGTDPDLSAMVDAILEYTFVYSKDAADGAAATTTADTYVGETKYLSELLEAYIITAGTLTAHDTNYATITVEKADGAGGTQTTIAEITTKITGGSGDWAAGTKVPITVAAGGASIAAGQVINFKIAKAGSGVAVPISAIILRFRRLEA